MRGGNGIVRCGVGAFIVWINSKKWAVMRPVAPQIT